MANIVFICGINTATLPKCSAEEFNELMKKLKSGDQSAREKLITLNMRLVLSIVQRFSVNKNNIDDIFQVGTIGLIKAIDNFNTDLGVRFSTYAVPMIVGEIRRFLRDNSALKITRSIRDTAYLALQAREKLLKTSSNEPTIEEISRAINLPIKQVSYALDAITEPVSLYDSLYSDDDTSAIVMDQIKDKTTEDSWIEKHLLSEAIQKINPREREILFMRYYAGKTQVEISDEIGISQAQVSRLEKTAISQIKSITA